MSNIGSYTSRSFSENQKFLVLDPSTGTTSLVLGSDLVSYITPQLNAVNAESTRLAAENTDYAVGEVIQTTGATSPGDNFAAVYLVVEGGTGDFPMINGNDLLIIRGDEFLREQLIDNTAGVGSDLVAHTGTANTVTETLDQNIADINKRTIYVESVAELEALPSPTTGQEAVVKGVPFIYDGSDWVPSAGYVTPEAYGTVTGDAAVALQAVADAAGSFSCSLRLLEPTYTTSKQITIPDGVNIEVMSSECVIDGGTISGIGDAPESAILLFGNGGLTQIADLSADVTQGDVSITFAAPHGLSENDVFCIWNPTDGSWNAARAVYRAGEWCRVVDVVSTTEVTISSPLFDSYASVDVEVYTMNSSKYSFSGGRLTAKSDSGLYAGLRGLRFINVIDTDISNTKGSVHQAVAGINILQCYNLFGTSVIGLDSGNSGGGLDYGISTSNSQHVHVDGYFSAFRHGSTIGGGDGAGSVVNRDIVISGVIKTSGESASVLAADWHGNCEWCEYRGAAIGGLTWGGNHNTFNGRITANEQGILGYATELRGFDFNFSGVDFYTKAVHSVAGRGVFDCGGNSAPLSADTIEGGTLNLSNTTWTVPNIGSTATALVTVRNRGASGQPLIIDMSNFRLVSPDVTLQSILRAEAVSGDAFSFVDLEGYWSDADLPWTIIDADRVRLWKTSVQETIATDSATNFTLKSVTFPFRYPFAPPVVASVNVQGTGADRLVLYPEAGTAAGFTFDLRTADNANFTTSTTVPVSWQAG